MRRSLAVAALCTLVVSSGASADTVQPIGPIAAMRFNNPQSDDFSSYHGFIVVGDSIGGYLTYKFGGNHCPGFDLEEFEVVALQRGMNNPRILVGPRTKQGAGGNQCMVGFTLVLRSDLGALP